MSEFKREDRYVVIKHKDLDESQRDGLMEAISLYDVPTREAVVVESDWQIYNKVWEMVEMEWVEDSK